MYIIKFWNFSALVKFV